tara:strand:+ start:2137 stop:2478 length:342 start_codon:yes stop_codon:yes gene_type:complete
MSYKDYCLKFDNESQWDSTAATLGWRSTDPTDKVWYGVQHGAVDIIGTMYNDDGGEETPATPKDGYHVNLRLKYSQIDDGVDDGGKPKMKDNTLPSELDSYVVTPSTPQRRFA